MKCCALILYIKNKCILRGVSLKPQRGMKLIPLLNSYESVLTKFVFMWNPLWCTENVLMHSVCFCLRRNYHIPMWLQCFFLINNKSRFWKSISCKINIKSQIVDNWAMKYIFVLKKDQFCSFVIKTFKKHLREILSISVKHFDYPSSVLIVKYGTFRKTTVKFWTLTIYAIKGPTRL